MLLGYRGTRFERADPVPGLDQPDRARTASASTASGSSPGPAQKRTPRSSSPSVTPVAAKKTLSPRTRSSMRQDLVEVVAGVQGGPALVVVAGPEPAVDGAAQALERAGGDHALGGAADPDEQVDAGLRPGGHDRAGDVAVEQELDPRARPRGPAGPAPLVAGPVEDGHRQLGHVGALGLGDAAQVVLDRGVEVDDVGGVAGRRPASPCRRTDPGRTWCRRSASATTAMALGRLLAVSVVPSTGSTAMSTSGRVPSPICSPL